MFVQYLITTTYSTCEIRLDNLWSVKWPATVFIFLRFHYIIIVFSTPDTTQRGVNGVTGLKLMRVCISVRSVVAPNGYQALGKFKCDKRKAEKYGRQKLLYDGGLLMFSKN